MGGLLKHLKFRAKIIQCQPFEIQNYESDHNFKKLVKYILFTVCNVLKTLKDQIFPLWHLMIVNVVKYKIQIL